VRSQPRNAGATRDRVAKILLVEDDASVRAAVRRALRSNGHDVIDTKSAEDAMMAWKEHGGVFDCVVSDVVMPGLHGPQLVSRLREDRPELPVLFTSTSPTRCSCKSRSIPPSSRRRSRSCGESRTATRRRNSSATVCHRVAAGECDVMLRMMIALSQKPGEPESTDA
jgi:CheY-like chemotaxis protein